jgi:hypothetical protein
MMGAALSVVATSCSDFIEEENKCGETADLVYSTASGADGLIASCYSFARGWYGKEAGLGLSEMGTDVFYHGYDCKQKGLVTYNLTAESLNNNTSDNPCLDHYWELFYHAVDVCNTALKYIPENKIIDETKKTRYEAEAYFLRAFYYFHIVNMWGDAPYYSEPASGLITAPVRTAEEEIYGNILADLDKSIELFTAAGYDKKADGRANLWAAKAFKARALLYAASWIKDFKKSDVTGAYAGKDLYKAAKETAEDVIANSGASFYDKYTDTWTLANEAYADNKEALFGIVYSSDLKSNTNCIPHRNREGQSDYVNIITRTGYSRGGSAMLLMFVSMWNNGCTDIGNNKDNTTTVFLRCTGESSAYITSAQTGEKVRIAEAYSPYGRGFTRYLPSTYLWQLLEKYRETDQRTDATLLSAYMLADPSLAGNLAHNYPNMTDTVIYYCPLDGNSPEGKAKQAWAKDRYRIQFLSGGDIPVMTSYDPAKSVPTEIGPNESSVYGDARYKGDKIGGWKSYPGIKKFLDDVVDANFLTHDISKRDAIVIRLPEMYLIKAECELKTGGNALTTINELRKARAIKGKDNTLSGTADIDMILDERAIELCGEQQRWFDLKRTGKLGERLQKYNAQASGSFDASKHYYRPIPQAEIDAITNFGNGFEQNVGY